MENAIGPEEIEVVVLETCPEMRWVMKNSEYGFPQWIEGGGNPIFLLLGLAAHSARLWRERRYDKLRPIFQLVERLHVDGSKKTAGIATCYFSEGLYLELKKSGVDPRVVRPLMGKETADWYDFLLDPMLNMKGDDTDNHGTDGHGVEVPPVEEQVLDRTPADTPALLDSVEEVLRQAGAEPVRENGSICLTSGSLRTVVASRPMEATTIDRQRVREILTVETALSNGFETATDIQMSTLNGLAATSALVRDPKRKCVSCASRFTLHADDGFVAGMYVRLLGLGALLQSRILSARMGGLHEGFKRKIIIPECDDPCRWTAEDIEETIALLEDVGAVADPIPGGLAAEYPWGQGPLAGLVEDPLCRIRLSTEIKHPVTGSGLFYHLALPFSGGLEEICHVANRLNLFELQSLDSPPFFGAWCADHDLCSPAYVGFMPNFIHSPGSACAMAACLLKRIRKVRSVVAGLLKGEVE